MTIRSISKKIDNYKKLTSELETEINNDSLIKKESINIFLSKFEDKNIKRELQFSKDIFSESVRLENISCLFNKVIKERISNLIEEASSDEEIKHSANLHKEIGELKEEINKNKKKIAYFRNVTENEELEDKEIKDIQEDIATLEERNNDIKKIISSKINEYEEKLRVIKENKIKDMNKKVDSKQESSDIHLENKITTETKLENLNDILIKKYPNSSSNCFFHVLVENINSKKIKFNALLENVSNKEQAYDEIIETRKKHINKKKEEIDKLENSFEKANELGRVAQATELGKEIKKLKAEVKSSEEEIEKINKSRREKLSKLEGVQTKKEENVYKRIEDNIYGLNKNEQIKLIVKNKNDIRKAVKEEFGFEVFFNKMPKNILSKIKEGYKPDFEKNPGFEITVISDLVFIFVYETKKSGIINRKTNINYDDLKEISIVCYKSEKEFPYITFYDKNRSAIQFVEVPVE